MLTIFWVCRCKHCGKTSAVRMFDLEVITDCESTKLSDQMYYWICKSCNKPHMLRWNNIPSSMRRQSELLNS